MASIPAETRAKICAAYDQMERTQGGPQEADLRGIRDQLAAEYGTTPEQMKDILCDHFTELAGAG